MVDCAGRLVVEAFYGSDEVVIDVIQPHGCSQSCVPNSVERLLWSVHMMSLLYFSEQWLCSINALGFHFKDLN